MPFEQTNDGMLRLIRELTTVRIRQAQDIASKLNHGALHPEADSEKRNLKFASKLNRLNLAFDASHAEAAGNQKPIDAFEKNLWPLPLKFLGFDTFNNDLSGMMKAGVVDRFVDRLVGVAMFDVLPDNSDRHFVPGISNPMDQGPVVVHFQWTSIQLQLLADQLIETMFNQADRNFVD